jgi:hypothetical protein
MSESAIVDGLAMQTSQQTISTVGLHVEKYRRRWCQEGAETRVWSQMRSLRLAVAGWLLQNLRESGASRILDHLLLVLALVLMGASSSLCSMHARVPHLRPHQLAGVRGPLYSSSSSTSPASRRNGEPNAEPGARGGGDAVRLLVDELVDPELELPLPMVIRPLCRRDICFLFCFSSDSSISTWIVASIGAWRMGGGDEGRTSTWCCEVDDVERGFFRCVTGVGL